MSATAQASRLTALIPDFRLRVEQTKATLGPLPFPWYSYDILSNVDRLEWMLEQAGLQLADLMAGNPALDIGCADGQLAFFMESLGYRVTAVDYPSTNANGMQAVRTLKGALGSSIEIMEADIDQGFTPPPGNEYSLVFLLGILYHLKNPFLILETLAKHADYCFLSTRVTRLAADRKTSIDELPVAYLLDPAETNNDITNYWIFTHPGLKRLIKRTGWEICSYMDVGATKDSDPVTAAGDERVFCLLRRATAFTNGRLLDGWSEPVGPRNGWRWAMQEFSVAFDRPSPEGSKEIELEIYLPPEQVQSLGRVTITATEGAQAIAEQTFSEPGVHRFRCSAANALPTLGFHVSPVYRVANGDPRPLGLIVNRIWSVASA